MQKTWRFCIVRYNRGSKMYTLFDIYIPLITHVQALHCTFEHVGGIGTTSRVKYNVVKYSRCGVLYGVRCNTLADRSKYQGD